jgi:hypothetical protein
MRGAREREAQAFADDLVVVHDQTGDLLASLPVFHHGLQDCMREVGGWGNGAVSDLLGLVGATPRPHQERTNEPSGSSWSRG